jgi:hypothetical protein
MAAVVDDYGADIDDAKGFISAPLRPHEDAAAPSVWASPRFVEDGRRVGQASSRIRDHRGVVTRC